MMTPTRNFICASLTFLTATMINGSAFAYKPGDPVPADFKMPAPLPLEASVASLKTVAGLKIERVAAEPLVMDPINIDWGPDGRLWVVEMADYPLGMDGQGQPGGRVRVLTDTDHDGVYDHATLFLDGLSFPTDLKVWRDGVLITLAGKIIYARDTDGDDRADTVDDLYTGFDDGNPQHLVNGMEWGLDNWLHLATGSGKGSAPRSTKTGKTLDTISADMRLRPDRGEIELLGGRSQYGRVRDTWGNWFGSTNSNPMFQHLLPAYYTARNPHLAPPTERLHVSDNPFAPRVYPTSATMARFNNTDSANFITSACSLLIYQDELLKKHIDNHWFICEPVHNLVHREPLKPDGLYFKSSRHADESESDFLTSSDPWFRPTAIKAGPNGALWVVDMHRFAIEHPQWIPEEWMNAIDVRAGQDRGRIYRVSPVNQTVPPPPNLAIRSTTQLVDTLASPTRWQRDTSQKLLIWRNDQAAVQPLSNTLQQSDNPLARLHALCTLDGLNAITASHLAHALKDPHPGVRRHAIRLSEPHLASTPSLVRTVANLAGDPNPHVRLQTALSLGESRHPDAGQALARLAVNHAGDRFLLAGVMSSALAHLPALLDQVLNATPPRSAPPEAYRQLIAVVIATNDQPALRRLLESITRPTPSGKDVSRETNRLVILLQTLQNQNRTLDDLNPNNDPDITRYLTGIQTTVQRIIHRAPNRAASDSDTRLALPMLGSRGAPRGETDLIGTWLTDPASPTLQTASAKRLAGIGSTHAFSLITSAWYSYTPRTKQTVLSTLLATTRGRTELFNAVERGDILPSSVGVAHRQALTGHANDEIRHKAQALFGSLDTNRQSVIDRYQSVNGLKGVPQRGQQLFTTTCATCHQVNGVGLNIGANLTALSDKSTPSLLIGILDPNRAVEDKFMLYIVTTQDDQTLSGMLTDESATSLTLAGLDGRSHTLLRRDIRSITSPGRSMMPEGLEAVLDPQGVADIIAFIQQTDPLAP